MKNTFKRLFKYLKNYRSLIVLIFICAVISVVSNLMGPTLIGRAIDKMAGKNQVDFSYIIIILLILAIVYGISTLFNWLLAYLTNKVSYNTGKDMRQELFEKINTLPLKFFDSTPQGDTISRFVNDIEMISEGLLQGLSSLITGLVMIIGASAFMLFLSPTMTLAVVASAPASYYVARFITKKSKELFKEQAKILGDLNGYAEEIISGEKVVQAFSYEKQTIKKFEDINSRLYEAGVKSQFYGSLVNPSTRLVNNITYSFIGIIGSALAILGKITVGEISSFLIYSNLFAKPFNEITGIYTQIQGAVASAQRVFSLFDIKEEESDMEDAQNMTEVQGNIGFSNVSFAYNKDHPLIQNFDLEVKKGDRVAIVGKTGAGKTTLVNLLMRFYDVDSGFITVDGINIEELTRDSLRKNFGMVLQDTWLFSGTIRENIAYGKPNATDEEIIAAAKAADAHSFIRRLPKGYDTLIMDSGENLSQGQRQLLTIARVMLVNPPMLILDEATSNIDTRTELRIQKSFLKMMEGRTSFIIAHRLSTIKDADIILVMDKGNIVEKGSHQELLKKDSYYSKLYNSQFAS